MNAVDRLLVSLLLCVPLSAWCGVPPEAVEAPLATVPVPVHPWQEHVGGSAAMPAAAAEATVDSAEIPIASAAELERLRAQPRAHLQGPLPTPPAALELAEPFDSRPPPFAQTPPPQPARAAAPQAQGDLLRSFAGIANSGWIPPDTQLAVGSEHVLEVTNSGYAIYSKTGRTVRAYTTMDAFFAGVRPANWAANGGFMFDPKVWFDPYQQKFVMFTLGRADVSEDSHLFVAISRSPDATREWWIWRFDWPEADSWVDYTSVASDQWGLYLTGDVFVFGGGFRYAQLWTLNPAMFNGGASNGWRFWDLRWPSAGNPLAFDLQVARPHSSAGGAETFLVNGATGSYNQLCLWKLTGDRTNAPTLVRTAIPVANYYPVYVQVRQPDTGARIDGFSTQLVEAAYSQRHVWASFTSGENSPTPTWGGLNTKRLNVDSNTVTSESLIWTANMYYTFPAVVVAPGTVGATTPNIGLFGTWTSPSQYASAIYYLDDVEGTDSFVNFRTGSASYVRLDDGGTNRWGDYTGAAYDWSCGTLWGAAEFAGTANTWGTQIAEVDFTGTGACPRIDVSAPLANATWYAGNPATVQWNGSALTAGNSLYVRWYKNGVYVGQLAGPLAIGATSAVVTMPWDTSSLAQIEVGSWNGSAWEAIDRSDAYFTLAAAPDLWVSGFSSPQTQVSAGAQLQLDAVAANAGNGSSAASTLRFYRSTNNIISSGDTLLGSSAVGGLAAGGNSNRQLLTTNTGTAGTWYFGACLDQVTNDPPGNNCTANPISVQVNATGNIFANGFE